MASGIKYEPKNEHDFGKKIGTNVLTLQRWRKESWHEIMNYTTIFVSDRHININFTTISGRKYAAKYEHYNGSGPKVSTK